MMRRRRGFTLIELLVVIAIIGLTDADQLNPVANPSWNSYPYFAPQVVHGKIRNTLFFDWHVEEITAEIAHLPASP